MKQQMRLTIVNVKIPFLTRLLAIFAGELVLAVLGNVQDIKVISRGDAQDLMDAQYQKKWVPYQDNAAPPPPAKGLRLEPPNLPRVG